jgi:hypothetical protein
VYQSNWAATANGSRGPTLRLSDDATLGDGQAQRCLAMWSSVILQALVDAGIIGGSTRGIEQIDRDRAVAFLTDRRGNFARDREIVASLAGVDGDALAESVRRKLATHPHLEALTLLYGRENLSRLCRTTVRSTSPDLLASQSTKAQADVGSSRP